MNQVITSRLRSLRERMKAKGIDAYIVPTDDFHLSEYVGEHFKCREFITGFTGSAGTAVILADEAGLWTDGRYFLQAETQLAGTGITLYKIGEPDVPTVHAFLEQNLNDHQCLGMDGRVISAEEVEKLKEKLENKSIRITCEEDLVGEIWKDRPALPCHPVMELEQKWTGKSRAEKCAEIRKKMDEKNTDIFVLSSLDDIAWLLNIRGGDVRNNPVVLSYLVMMKNETYLFANKDAFSEELQNSLAADGCEILPYDDIYEFVKSFTPDERIYLSKANVNYRLVNSIHSTVEIVDGENFTLYPKAIKTATEVANERKAHIKDAVALTKFIYWLKTNAASEKITELSAAEKLFELRSQQEHFMGESFDPIIAYGEHAAIIHYSATPETNVTIQPRGLLLADTGGQYMEGTTDVTRTIVVGPVTDKEKKYFTAVLKGTLRLAAAKFKYGTCGLNLDYLARQALWEIGADYNHGTGHGVGYFLNVHEGPNSFHWKATPTRRGDTVFEEGMITSDEPGYYEAGAFGIRHENLLVCRKAEQTEYGQFLCFEHLTLVPFDIEGILVEDMSDTDLKLLNEYHRKVYSSISSYLTEEERKWLQDVTKPIMKL